MKKFIFTMVAAMFLTTAMAQDVDSSQKKHKHMGVAEMVNKRTQQMTEKYALSTEQSEKLKALNEKYMAKPGKRVEKQVKNGERPDQPMNAEKKNPERKHKGHKGPRFDMTAYNNELKGILNETQYNAYVADMEKRKAEMMNHRKNNQSK